jgi:TolA-binding protein
MSVNYDAKIFDLLNKIDNLTKRIEELEKFKELQLEFNKNFKNKQSIFDDIF